MTDKLDQTRLTRRGLMVGGGAVIASSILTAGKSHAEELLELYDGKLEAPCYPEAIASLLDPLIQSKDAKGEVILSLVHQRHPSAWPPSQRSIWICMRDARPLWFVDSLPKNPIEENSGSTAAMLKRVRTFIAEHVEFKGKERLLDDKVDEKTLDPAYQSEIYGTQITELKLADRETETWEVTAKPVQDGTMGGEIWMRVNKHSVTAEFGR